MDKRGCNPQYSSGMNRKKPAIEHCKNSGISMPVPLRDAMAKISKSKYGLLLSPFTAQLFTDIIRLEQSGISYRAVFFSLLSVSPEIIRETSRNAARTKKASARKPAKKAKQRRK